jgi:hypothetical protein
MSALPPKADIRGHGWNVCFVPIAALNGYHLAVVKYIDDRPARMHENFKVLAIEALRAAWPCEK